MAIGTLHKPDLSSLSLSLSLLVDSKGLTTQLARRRIELSCWHHSLIRTWHKEA